MYKYVMYPNLSLEQILKRHHGLSSPLFSSLLRTETLLKLHARPITMSRLIRFFAIGLAFIAAAGVQASALPAEKDADLPVTDVTWEVEIRPGETVSLNGTIQSVYAQVLELNPQFETDMADQIADRMKGLEVAQEEVKGMVKRDHSECGGYGGNMRRINEGIEYLFRLGGSPSIGPGECGRVSCSWNSGIWWCSHVSQAFGCTHDF